jgi:hypothetical protein
VRNELYLTSVWESWTNSGEFSQVFTRYNKLLVSENYVTRRQSLKLLGEILLDRANFEIMMKYIGCVLSDFQ